MLENGVKRCDVKREIWEEVKANQDEEKEDAGDADLSEV